MNKKANTIRSFRSNVLIIIAAFVLIAITYLVVDYSGPSKISIKHDHAFGMNCLRARDLIVQEYDIQGTLWATRGMIIYRLNQGDSAFIKVAHVPTGFSIFWLRNFTLLRRFTVRPECIEMVPFPNGDLCALSAGSMWYRQANCKKIIKTLELAHYGIGDQGIRNDGIFRVNDSTIFFGEYFQNAERTEVRIFESRNYGKTWKVAYTFKPGQVRHIHAIQKDPYSGKLWICVGDNDDECMVAWSDDEFKTLITIGKGSQLWRVCQLVFTEDAIFWGSDNSSEDLVGIYRLDKTSHELTKIHSVDGAVFFGTRLSQGTVVMSTDREGFDTETDLRTRLFLVEKDKKVVSTIVGGTWKHHKPGFKFKFAQLRFQRNQGSPSLAISCLNQKEFPDGDLLIISESELINAATNGSR